MIAHLFAVVGSEDDQHVMSFHAPDTCNASNKLSKTLNWRLPTAQLVGSAEEGTTIVTVLAECAIQIITAKSPIPFGHR